MLQPKVGMQTETCGMSVQEATTNGLVFYTFSGTGAFKFRANDAWDFNLGGALDNLAKGGDNIATPGAGAYYVVLTTSDDGATWKATVEAKSWGFDRCRFSKRKLGC
jgi:hypothetical protein